jgi:hypothetical protein
MARRRPRSYRQAVQWLLDNDDTKWLDSDHGSLSVAANLVADMYDRTADDVTRDLWNIRSDKLITRRLEQWNQP